MSVKKVNKTTGATTKVAGLVNSEKVNTMYEAFPSDASASNKLVSDATADEKISDESQVIFEVMGEMGAKNLLPYPYDTSTVTKNNVSFTDNGDGTITISTLGDRSSNTFFDLSKGINFGDSNWSLIGSSEKEKTIGSFIASNGLDNFVSGLNFGYTVSNMQTWIVVSPSAELNNVTIKPMIRLASDPDNTYQPYAKTNQQLTQDKAEQAEVNDIVNALGAKNIMPFILSDIKTYNNGGTWNGNSYTQSGVTFTLDIDEKGSLKDVVVDGTATANTFFTLTNWANKTGFIGKILNGCTEGSTTTFAIIISYRDSNNQYITDKYQVDNDCVVEDVSGSAILKFMIFVKSGVTISNKKFYPMLRYASITDNTYQPPSKTNKQLTEDTTALLDNLEVNGAVNILKYPYLATTGTSSGISITDNGDGTISFAAGTVSSSSACTFWFERYATGMSAIELRGKTVKFSVDMSEALQYDSTTARIEFSIADSTDTTISGTNNRVPLNNTHNEWIVTVPSNADHFSVMLWIAKNTVLPSFTLSPMITLASYNGDYVPYAKSNKELTEDVAEMVRGGGYVYPLPNYFYHIAITATKGSGQFIKLITNHGEVKLATSSQSMAANTLARQKVLINDNTNQFDWTYSVSGLTANLNCTGHVVGYIISNYPLTFTVVDTSTPEANTLNTLNLALLSNS